MTNLQVDIAEPFVVGSPAMRRRLLKSKIHRAVITDADVEYEGSITLDREIMDAADLVEFEEVHVWDIANGNRIITYVMEGKRGSGVVAMNGAAALLVKKDDVVIIGSFADYDEDELQGFKPRKIFVDQQNKILSR